jgi:hypothetical protein
LSSSPASLSSSDDFEIGSNEMTFASFSDNDAVVQ